jgi:hypothetical protein
VAELLASAVLGAWRAVGVALFATGAAAAGAAPPLRAAGAARGADAGVAAFGLRRWPDASAPAALAAVSEVDFPEGLTGASGGGTTARACVLRSLVGAAGVR